MKRDQHCLIGALQLQRATLSTETGHEPTFLSLTAAHTNNNWVTGENIDKTSVKPNLRDLATAVKNVQAMIASLSGAFNLSTDSNFEVSVTNDSQLHSSADKNQSLASQKAQAINSSVEQVELTETPPTVGLNDTVISEHETWDVRTAQRELGVRWQSDAATPLWEEPSDRGRSSGFLIRRLPNHLAPASQPGTAEPFSFLVRHSFSDGGYWGRRPG